MTEVEELQRHIVGLEHDVIALELTINEISSTNASNELYKFIDRARIATVEQKLNVLADMIRMLDGTDVIDELRTYIGRKEQATNLNEQLEIVQRIEQISAVNYAATYESIGFSDLDESDETNDEMHQELIVNPLSTAPKHWITSSDLNLDTPDYNDFLRRRSIL